MQIIQNPNNLTQLLCLYPLRKTMLQNAIRKITNLIGICVALRQIDPTCVPFCRRCEIRYVSVLLIQYALSLFIGENGLLELETEGSQIGRAHV